MNNGVDFACLMYHEMKNSTNVDSSEMKRSYNVMWQNIKKFIKSFQKENGKHF